MFSEILHRKIKNADYIRLIEQNCAGFSAAEQALLEEIVSVFEFDVIQAQALAQAVAQQARFDPNVSHIEFDDDEDTTAICPHCLNPPMPPLLDYREWRKRG
ncbi:MAG: hypothetical protein Q4A84_05480 [Neisseria sp.]|uniref:hypothetical protein n=1 Tax=Neisseria sp. TaxID=192066 RepID=UPI0026DC11FA|nr:hypothetical protein [Neisseria sp.]MDO4641139.1 hypothetical protein [Neisseria sp.]